MKHTASNRDVQVANNAQHELNECIRLYPDAQVWNDCQRLIDAIRAMGNDKSVYQLAEELLSKHNDDAPLLLISLTEWVMYGVYHPA